MSGRIVFVPEGWQLRPSETATADDYAAWVKNGSPPPPDAAKIDALVTDELLEGIGDQMADTSGLPGLNVLNDSEVRWLLKAAFSELLGVKS